MRTLMVVVGLAAGMSAYTALPAAAADEKAKREVAVVVVERIQDLNLTDEQEAKIAQIRKEYKPKVQEAAKELAAVTKEEVEKARAVLTDEQRTKLAATKEVREERRHERLAERLAHLDELDLTGSELAKVAEIRKEYQPRIVKALESLRSILTEDQRTAREEALKAGKNRKEVIAALNLKEDQKEKVETAGKEVRTLVREELEKMGEVLSQGQKEKLAEFKEERREHARDRMAAMIMNHKELNLTAEQQTKIAEIRKEYRPKVHEAGNKLRATIREEVDALVNVLKG